MDKTNEFYDNTMLGSYKECPRRYFIRHVLGWRKEGLAMPLTFGLSWHDAMDVVWTYAKQVPQAELPRLALAKFIERWEEQGLPGEPDIDQATAMGARTPGTAHEMLHNYVAKRWAMLQEAALVACEQPFAVPMPGMEGVWYIGRLDKVLDYQQQRLVIEHKTTSEYKIDGGFKTQWVEGWYSDSQVKGYQFGGGLFFENLTQVWVDGALVHKKVHDAFKFVPVAHQFPMLEEWITDTRQWVTRVQRDTAQWNANRVLKDGNFPKNENSCLGKYGACQFKDICQSVADPSKLDSVPQGYKEERWEPFDILGMDKLINK